MATKATEEAKNILKESLKELESPKGSVLTGVQKLSRASNILGDEDIFIWCEIQLGNPTYTFPLENYISKLSTVVAEKNKNGKASTESKKELQNTRKVLKDLKLKQNIHFTGSEIIVKNFESGGGYSNIGTIEEIYTDLVRAKKGNDGTYYKRRLQDNISYVKKVAYSMANRLYNKIVFSDIPQTAFDVLKEEVDDKLLDLDPELAEKLMLAFRGVMSDKQEEWSQALTSCRRLIEGLANNLYPSTDKKINGRSLGKNQYINRLWAFMDNSIESNSDKELAKAHVNFLGKYLESTHDKTHKGVHAVITRYEAIKTVLHTYLVIADILDYLDQPETQNKKLNIHTASLDEIESVLGTSRTIAKDIFKLRFDQDSIDEEKLLDINGVGPRTVSKAKEFFSFD